MDAELEPHLKFGPHPEALYKNGERQPSEPLPLKVGAFLYTFEENDEWLTEHNNWGVTDHWKLTFSVFTKMPLERQRETSWHEAMHMMDAWANPSNELSEPQLASLSHAMFVFFQQNKNFMKWVIGSGD